MHNLFTLSPTHIQRRVRDSYKDGPGPVNMEPVLRFNIKRESKGMRVEFGNVVGNIPFFFLLTKTHLLGVNTLPK